MSELVGQQLGHYKLTRFLGDGSFADVYLGENIYLKKPIAIKVLRTYLSMDDKESFFIEARTLVGLEHPNIVQVLDYGEDQNVPFLVMNYASHGTLRQRHPNHSILSPTVVLSYVKQIASALQYAHDKKLIHRDVKPHNMLLGAKDELWLSDFGLVLVAHNTISQITQEAAGTPYYMAPELFNGKPRPASDQYALAVVVYEWLCGEHPFQGSYFELFNQHTSVPAPSLREKVPAISPAMEEVVLKALAKDPHQRFASVQAFADALEEAYRSQPYLLPGSDADRSALSSQKELPPPMRPPDSFLGDFDTQMPTILSPVVPLPSAQDEIAIARDKLSVVPEDKSVPEFPKNPAPIGVHKEPKTPLPSVPIAIFEEPKTPLPPVLSQFQGLSRRGISRRKVLVGLAGGIVLASGVATVIWKYSTDSTVAPPSVITPHSHGTAPTPTRAATSTAVAVGTPILIYAGHGGVKAAVWSPDGKYIASGGEDKMVHVWDVATGKDILNPPYGEHTRALNSVAWSPDGKYIASGGEDKTVHVWDASIGKDLPFSPYRQHSATVRCVAWSPDGKYIASGGEDETVHVWDTSSGTDRFPPYTKHIGKVIGVAWSPDGTQIASASLDGTVRVWSSTTGQDIQVLTFPPYPRHFGERAVAWFPHDGRYIVSGGDDNNVYLWDATTGQLIFTFSGHTQSIQSVAWSPNGQYIASGSFDTTVKIWSFATRKLVFTYSHHTNQVWSVVWSADGQRIASASVDGTVQIWKAL